MCTLIQKFDVKAYSLEKITSLFREVFYGTNEDLVKLSSPRVKDSAYSTVLKFCYYAIAYVLLNEKI